MSEKTVSTPRTAQTIGRFQRPADTKMIVPARIGRLNDRSAVEDFDMEAIVGRWVGNHKPHFLVSSAQQTERKREQEVLCVMCHETDTIQTDVC